MALDSKPSQTNAHLPLSLIIGVPSIDKEHEELIIQLVAAFNDPDVLPDSESFSSVLSSLGGQIVTHFTNEEMIFKSLGMPEDEVLSHVQAHIDILDQYARINLDLMRGKSLSRIDVMHMIKAWIIGHVVSFDLNIKKYLPETDEATST